MPLPLIITDASPLITLAVADSLDVLTLLDVQVIIPDMVYFEVTRHLDSPGASKLLEWIRINQEKKVSIRATEVFEEFKILEKAIPNIRSKHRGEQAAAELLNNYLSHNGPGAILLFEDSDVKKAAFISQIPPNVLMMSTSEYLDGLERRNLIASADAILSAAVSIR
jgi:hypothetical protein